MPPENSTPPLLLLGLDSFDSAILQLGIREGWLPALASFVEHGALGSLSRPRLMLDVPVWASSLSGLGLDQLGFFNIRQIKPGTYELPASTPHHTPALPFWSCLAGAAGKTAAIIDALDVNLVPGLAGFQLINWAGHHPFAPPIADPPELLDEVQRVFGPQIPVDENPASTPAEDRALLQVMLTRIEKKGKLVRRLLGRGRFDLAFASFTEAHTTSHQFWRYGVPGRPLNGPAVHEPVLANAIRSVCQAIDTQIGLVLAQLPAQANVLIFSPMGLVDQYPIEGLMESFCQQLGYHLLWPAERSGLTPRSLVRRLVPLRWRDRLRGQLSSDAQERLTATKYAGSTDWARTTLFAIPAQFEGLLRVNLRGREPQGIVEPGREYEDLLRQVEADLRQLVDPLTGGPAIEEVLITAHNDSGRPPHLLPDLVVFWRPAPHFIEQLVHPRAALRQQATDFNRGTGHSRSGFIAAAGPSITARGAIHGAGLLDLAPTALSLLGLPPDPAMTGRAIPGIVGG